MFSSSADRLRENNAAAPKSGLCGNQAVQGTLMAEPIRLKLFENYRLCCTRRSMRRMRPRLADEGLDVRLLPSPGPGRAEAALAAGEWTRCGWARSGS
jgi:hypothetical protein